MKPIKLVIKGLNSFIEEQTIDFEKLTDRGLFGIFGPTGSGKSTILDGITLALYGDIARKSSNYINTNCNDLHVSFTFQISGQVNHIYVVTRHFRRDKNTGNAKTHAANVVEYTSEGEEVLAEGANQVTKTCKEILGLSLEDFTRTVVLPQGKFSEFLKLEGKNRREMLERLFGLQEYGDQLNRKLGRNINKEKEHYNQLIGEMKGYEDVSETKLLEEKEKLVEAETVLKELQGTQEKMALRHKESEEVWNLQEELSNYMQKYQALEMKKEQIAALELQVKRGESARRVYPSIEAYEKTKESMARGKESFVQLNQNFEKLSKEKEEKEAIYEQAKKEKEEKLPSFNTQIEQLADLINDGNELAQSENELKDIQDKLEQLTVGIQKLKEQEASYNQFIDNLSTQIAKLQEEEQALKVDETVRQKVQEGVMLTQRYEIEQKELTNKQTQIKELEQLQKTTQEIYNQLKQKADEKEKALNAEKEKLTQLEQTPMMSQEQLMAMQSEVTLAQEKWQRFTAVTSELEKYQSQQIAYTQEATQLKEQIQLKKVEVDTLQAAFEEEQLHHLAHTLRAKLHVGDACPVCHGTIHEIIQEENGGTTIQEKQIHLQEAKAELDNLDKMLTKVQMQLETAQEHIKRLEEEIEPLKELFKTGTLQEKEEELIQQTQTYKAYEENKKQLQERFEILKEQKAVLDNELIQKETLLQQNDKQLTKLVAECQQKSSESKLQLESLEKLKKEVDADNFEKISQEIQLKDKKREQLNHQVVELSKEKEERIKEKEKLQDKLNNYKNSYGRGIARFDEKQKLKITTLSKMSKKLIPILAEDLKGETSLYEMLNQKHGQMLTYLEQNPLLAQAMKGLLNYQSILDRPLEDEQGNLVTNQEALQQLPLLEQPLVVFINLLKQYLELLQSLTTNLMQQYEMAEKANQEVLTAYDQVSKALLEVKAKLEGLIKRLEEEKQLMDKGLEEEKLTLEEAKAYLLDKVTLEAYIEQINNYKQACSKLAGAMENAKKKLADRKLSLDEWQAIKAEFEQINEAVKMQNEKYINLTTLVKNIEKALERVAQLSKEKEQVEHKMGILAELDKLFKGKRFVEYVASTRLKYISIEASKKLKEITCGNYGLEVDEDGRFIIRDYKNGGAQRDASTLSGGETFLASLALALALSAEIQLKGTAPLELFFLDEGFGTLDDELLEIVMSSLERIHHDKLKVGIISHVEAIKSRVPVKLLLKPAEAGMGGTKVSLERS